LSASSLTDHYLSQIRDVGTEGPGTAILGLNRTSAYLSHHGVRRTPSSSIYRLGLALFDLEQPEKCLIRADSWMFAPEAEYERHGDVQDVVFPPIRALRWRTAVFAVSWPGWTSMAIPNILATVG